MIFYYKNYNIVIICYNIFHLINNIHIIAEP